MSAQPSVCSAMNSVSMSPFSTSRCRSAVQQRQVGAGLDLQEEVRAFGGGGAARIDDDQLRTGLHSVHHPQVEDRVTVGHVGADDEKQVAAIEIGVGAGRAVGAERLLESGARAGHAQPRVRLDVHRPQEALRQLVGQVLRLDGHLTGHVERDRVGTVLVDDRPQPPAGFGDRVVDRRWDRLLATGWPKQGRCQPPVDGGHHLGVCRTLGTEPAEVGRMQLVPGHLGDDGGARVTCGRDFDAAADTAVRARGAGRCHQPAGAGTEPTSLPVRVLAVRIRRNTAHVTTAQMT